MSRSLVAAAKTALAALGIDGVSVAISFSTAALHLSNTSRNVTVGSTEYTALGPRGIRASGVGENLFGEVSSADIEISSAAFGYHAQVLADSLRGDTCTVTLLYSTGTAWATTGWSTTFTVDADAATSDVVRVRLASADAARGTAVPRRSTQEYGCQHNYKRGGCSYRGSLLTCDKGYDTPNGCRAHFPDVTIAGETYPQPKPYGAFLGHIDAGLVLR